jgi:hypothetical protein
VPGRHRLKGIQDTTAAPNGTGHDTGDLVNQAVAFVDVATAAARLGISEDGVRRRVQPGRLLAIKGTDGQPPALAAVAARWSGPVRQAHCPCGGGNGNVSRSNTSQRW